MRHKVKEEQLTAYALNELSGKERNRIENIIQSDPELQLEVEFLKEFCFTVKTDLQTGLLPELDFSQRQYIKNQLVLEHVKARFNFSRLFEWKILVPSVCIPALSLMLFLNMSERTLSTKGKSEVEQADTRRASFASLAPYKTSAPAGINSVKQRLASAPYNQNNQNNYDTVFNNGIQNAPGRVLSTLPATVNTAGYDTVRKFLVRGQLPPVGAVKSEEMINFFDYNYPSSDGPVPFSVITEISSTPWNKKHKLMHIGVKGSDIRVSDNQYAKFSTVARDVKISFKFDPEQVSAFKLVGYDNLDSSERNYYHDSEIYIKELYPGHVATILYELIPTANNVEMNNRAVSIKYQADMPLNSNLQQDKIMKLKLGYKLPGRNQWHVIAYPIDERYVPFDETSNDFRFASAVAGFGMLLKNSPYNKELSYNDVINIANGSKGNDAKGYKTEFVRLVETASNLDQRH